MVRDPAQHELNRIDAGLASLPSTTIKAGTTFTFVLTYDSNNNVTGCRYSVNDPTGKLLGSQTLAIVGQTLRTTGKPATTANLAPIAALTFNIGGDYGGAAATLTEGAGTINVFATNSLSGASSEPSFTDFDDGTAETANVKYGNLPTFSSTSFSRPCR
jgi:hypothetical protein